jgi:hypothetical protein
LQELYLVEGSLGLAGEAVGEILGVAELAEH